MAVTLKTEQAMSNKECGYKPLIDKVNIAVKNRINQIK